jgi:hypothetical protein
MQNLVKQSPSMLRQHWLETALAALRGHFAKAGHAIPANTRVSIGWGYGRAEKILGQCWASAASSDKHHEIFISPMSKDSAVILGALAHELVHAVDNNKHGHKGPFKQIALAIGLEGKATTMVTGQGIAAFAAAFIKKHGAYPAGSLSKARGPAKKQGTRLIKCECGECGYVVRTTAKWLEEAGAPYCGHRAHGRMETEGSEDDGK